MLNKRKEFENKLNGIDYRQANMRAGYYYRIDDFVLFRFDVHAMIFSDDVPTLENALNKAFEKRFKNAKLIC